MVLNSSTCPISFLYQLSPGSLNLTEVLVEAEATLDHQLGSSVALATALLAGSLLVLLAGARLVKPTLFLSSFGVTFFAALVVVKEGLDAVPAVSALASCVALGAAPLIVGLLGGLLALCCLRVGFALLGAALGAGAGSLLYAAGLAAVPALQAHHDLVSLGCLCVGAIVGAALLLKFQKGMLIVATSGAGAAGATPALALLLAHANAAFVAKAQDKTSPFGWWQPCTTIVLFAVGLAVQCRAGQKRKARGDVERTTPLMQP